VAEHGLAPEAPVPLLRVPARHQPVAAGEVHRLAAVELRTDIGTSEQVVGKTEYRAQSGNAERPRELHGKTYLSWAHVHMYSPRS
jgi:hypothetical protein